MNREYTVHLPRGAGNLSQALLLAFLSASVLAAQTAPGPSATGSSVKAEDIIELSPFQVRASSDMGYQANETLAGTRLNTPLKDVPTQVNVMTPEFLQDLALDTLDLAFRYSLNAENKYEDFIGNLTDTSNAIFGGRGRARGINSGSPNRTHDFFDSSVFFDSYNVERFTFASGPNSILFGNSAAVGTIDTTFKRALLNKRLYSVQMRVDNWASTRVSADVNVPILKNKLGVRFDVLNDRKNDWRKPGFYDQDRFYGALTYTPLKWLTVRLYNETAQTYKNPVMNGLVQDHVTPWIEAGKPAFNNGGGLTAAFPATPATSVFARFGARPVFAFDPSGPVYITGGQFVGQANNQVYTKGYDSLTPSPDNFERNIMDQSLYPWNRNFSGNVNQSRTYSYTRSAIVEMNPIKNLYFEAGINQEHNRFRGVAFFNSAQAELAVDANQFLQDRVTPNPYFGRYFFDILGGSFNPAVGKGYIAKEEKRASVSYDLNFTERENWTKWFGRHRAAFLIGRIETTSLQNQSPYQLVGTYAFPNGVPAFRYYIDPAQDNWVVNLPFNTMQDGKFTLPQWKDANGKQVYMGTWDTDPADGITPNNFGASARQQMQSKSLAWQGWLWKDRIVLNYGVRRDDIALQSFSGVSPDPDFNRISVNSGKLPWVTTKTSAPHNRLKGFVVHPFNFLSLFWSESSSLASASLLQRDLTGAPKLGNKGTGRDYGIMLSWKDRVSLRVNKFYNAGGAQIASTGDTTTPTGTVPGLATNNLKVTINAIERAVQMNAPGFNPANPTVVAPSLLTPPYAYYQQDVANNMLDGTGAASANLTNMYRVFSDQVSKGYEVTLTGNPTSQWRVSVTGSKTDVVETNIGTQWLDFIKTRLPVWTSAQNIDAVIPQSGTTPVTIRTALPTALLNWNYLRLSNGRPQVSPRYRYNVLTRYSFNEGRLKGGFVGANFLWRSAAVVGFPNATITDNPFTVPGIAAGTITVSDVSHPNYGNVITSIDGFCGYSFRLYRGKIRWLVQLNVRNILDRDDPVVVQSYSNGQPAFYRSTEPRTWILTNSFDF